MHYNCFIRRHFSIHSIVMELLTAMAVALIFFFILLCFVRFVFGYRSTDIAVVLVLNGNNSMNTIAHLSTFTVLMISRWIHWNNCWFYNRITSNKEKIICKNTIKSLRWIWKLFVMNSFEMNAVDWLVACSIRIMCVHVFVWLNELTQT